MKKENFRQIRKMKKPLVSIIIPTFNEEKYIGACLASIKRQKSDIPYEIIIGDGNSTDKTHRIAKSYGARVVVEHFKTPSGGRHSAARAARGDLLAFVSADVELDKKWLNSVVLVFNDKKVAWAVGGVRPYEGNIIEEIGAVVLNFFACTLNSFGVAYVNADNLFARKKAYFSSGGFNPKLVTSEDTDLGMRLMRQGRFAYAQHAIAHLSMRRVRKWGYLRFIIFHTSNFFSTHLFSSSAERYEPIR